MKKSNQENTNKLVIYGETNGYGQYYLILPQRLCEGNPVCLETHISSDSVWARSDLTQRYDRKDRLNKLFGENNWDVEYVIGYEIEEMYAKCDEINKHNEQISFEKLSEIYN